MSTALDRVEQAGTAVDVPAAEQRRLAALYKQCASLAKSDLVPKALQNKPDNVFALALYGEQFGLTPIHAIQRIYIIQGTFEPKAEVLAGVIMRAGHELRWDEVSSERCTVSIRRAGTDYWQSTTWTIDQAKKAGLLDVWVERWVKSDGRNFKEVCVVGDDNGIFTADERQRRALGPVPEWAQALVDAGKMVRKDPWFQFPDDMLAAKALRRGGKRIVGDALLGLSDDVDVLVPLTPEKVVAARLPDPGDADGEPFDPDPADEADGPADLEPDGEHGDDGIEDAEEVHDPPAEAAPAADPGPPADESGVDPFDDGEPVEPAGAREAVMKRLMVTCGQAFPETDAPKGKKTHRQRLLRRAAQYAVLKEHRSASDLDVDELERVEAWVHRYFVSESAVTPMVYEVLDGDVVRFTLGDKSVEVSPPESDPAEAA